MIIFIKAASKILQCLSLGDHVFLPALASEIRGDYPVRTQCLGRRGCVPAYLHRGKLLLIFQHPVLLQDCIKINTRGFFFEIIIISVQPQRLGCRRKLNHFRCPGSWCNKLFEPREKVIFWNSSITYWRVVEFGALICVRSRRGCRKGPWKFLGCNWPNARARLNLPKGGAVSVHLHIYIVLILCSPGISNVMLFKREKKRVKISLQDPPWLYYLGVCSCKKEGSKRARTRMDSVNEPLINRRRCTGRNQHSIVGRWWR